MICTTRLHRSILGAIPGGWKDLRLLQRILRLDVARLPSVATAGCQLEFIGADGVGKTTLFNSSIAKRRRRWLFPHNLGEDRSPASPDAETSRLHRRLLMDGLRRLDREIGDHRWCLVRSSQLGLVVLRSLQCCDAALPRGVAHHEGLFKNLAESVVGLGPELRPLWRGRCFVHLRTDDPELVVDRLRRRCRRRGIPFDRRSALRRFARQRAIHDEMARMADSFGQPILTLQAEADFRDSVRRVLEFESARIG